jgi:hypothetical protein
MVGTISFPRAGVMLVALATTPFTVAVTTPANAVVYCKSVGVPQGCVARPGARAAVRAATPGVGAPGVGVRPGTPLNRGGPVNRAGRR